MAGSVNKVILVPAALGVAALEAWLRGQGYSPLLVAADLQRPNAVNQLQVVGQRAAATLDEQLWGQGD